MNTKEINTNNILRHGRKLARIFFLILTVGWFVISCQKEEEIVVSDGSPIVLSVSDKALALSQQQAYESVFSLSWTPGTNHGTSSSISYTLEIDIEDNDFATAQVYDLGKREYEMSFTGEELNDLLLNYWGVESGTAANFEARVTADVTKDGVEDGVSETITFMLTPYKPVSEELYIIGSSTPAGWDITNATAMVPNASEPWIFSYEGQMKTGTFKFAVNTESCWCQDFYTMDPNDASKMVYNQGGSGDDLQWEITEGGNYKITVNLLELRITMKKLIGPQFTELYIIGDASPSGWNIESPEAFTQSSSNPFIFTYEAELSAGDFKISTFTGNWCDGQWINAAEENAELTSTSYVVTNGCDGPDNKWHVTEENTGRYLITVNLYTETIKIEKVVVYLIGDASPNGWNISSPEPMTLANGVYVFEGALGANNATGEFKFSKYKGDWCDGDWIIATSEAQSISNTSHSIRHGCDGDDFKWKLKDGEAGNYRITVDLVKDIITIDKQ